MKSETIFKGMPILQIVLLKTHSNSKPQHCYLLIGNYNPKKKKERTQNSTTTQPGLQLKMRR